MNNNKAIADAFAACCITYDQQFSVEKAKVYSSLLEGYSAEEISNAFRDHMKDTDRGRFFPKPADVIYQIEKRNKVSSEGLADLEWAKIIKAASKGVKPNDCNQYALAALQITGGLKVVGFAEQTELARLKKTFIDSYKTLVECSAAQVPGHLSNYAELKQIKQQVVKRD